MTSLGWKSSHWRGEPLNRDDAGVTERGIDLWSLPPWAVYCACREYLARGAGTENCCYHTKREGSAKSKWEGRSSRSGGSTKDCCGGWKSSHGWLFLQICKVKISTSLKRHIWRVYLPWFWRPDLACWKCEKACVGAADVEDHHRKRHPEGEFQTEDQLAMWMDAMEAILELRAHWFALSLELMLLKVSEEVVRRDSFAFASAISWVAVQLD